MNSMTGVVTLAGIALAHPVSASTDEVVAQFVESCIGTLPDFSKIAQSLANTEFRNVSAKQWIRDSDAAVLMIEDASDRWVCMVGLPGDQVAPLTTSMLDALADNKLGIHEEKQYQGRSLYLLQAKGGLTILEVIPPVGATTFLVANSRKE